jgi:hypothetical protein
MTLHRFGWKQQPHRVQNIFNLIFLIKINKQQLKKKKFRLRRLRLQLIHLGQ